MKSIYITSHKLLQT